VRLDASPEDSTRAAGLHAGFPARRRVEVRMDTLVNQLARQLADAIAAAVAEDSRVEACRERARTAGLDLRVSLEAVVGFVNRDKTAAVQKSGGLRKLPARQTPEMTANDRRFLKSLRIAADETTEKEVE
jgi:hypothetical protein